MNAHAPADPVEQPGSVLAGVSVAKAPWPRDVVLVAIERDEAVLVPRGDIVIDAGDRLSIFADQAARPELDALLASTLVPPAPDPAPPATGA